MAYAFQCGELGVMQAGRTGWLRQLLHRGPSGWVAIEWDSNRGGGTCTHPVHSVLYLGNKNLHLSLSLRDCISGFGGFHISLVSEVNVLSTFKGGMGWLGWGGGRGRDEMT